DLGHLERDRRAEQRDDVRVVLLVRREDEARDLRLVHEALGEERADRAVDLARREDLLLARPTLALEEAARDLARGVALLAVLDREREEGEMGRRVLHRGRAEHDGVAELDQAGALRELRHAAELEREGPARELAF